MHAPSWCRALAVVLTVAAGTPARAGDLILWWPNREDRAALDRVVTAYNATRGTAGPHVTVAQVVFEGMADRVAGAIPRGKGPDLFVYPQDRLGGWVDAGGLVEPIDHWLTPVIRDRFVPAALDALTYRHVAYALPLGIKTLLLYYNPRLVNAAPRSTAELSSLAARLTDRKRGIYGFAYQYENYYYHAALQNGFGGRVLDGDANPAIDSPENLAALNLMLRWRRDLLPEDAPHQDEMAALFEGGKVAMAIEGFWFRGQLARNFTYRVAPLPVVSEAGDRPMRPWLSVDGMYVSARSAQKEAAWDFVRYVTSLEAARTIALESTDAPAHQKVYLEPTVLADPVMSTMLQQVRTAIPMPNLAEMTAMWTPATVALGTVARGKATPDAALAKAQAQMSRNVALLRGRP